jgi:tetratricopeptide (TPR) repeat protein
MARNRRSVLTYVLASLLFLSLVGVYVLITPDNPITALFRGNISTVQGKVITGPYPLKGDFVALRDHGVRAIISLLDPKIPYESILLDREKELAKKYGIAVHNFPMASILGQHFGAYYESNAELASKTIDTIQGKVYLHCYLGVHRMTFVRDMLQKRGMNVGTYTVRDAERTKEGQQLDAAIAAFRQSDFEKVIQCVSSVKEPDGPSLLIRGWSYLRINKPEFAKRDFQTVAANWPKLGDSYNGLGFVFLRESKLDSAENCFIRMVEKDARNGQAHYGLGLVSYRLGRISEACDHLSIALQADSTNTEVKELYTKLTGRRNG